MEQSEPLAALWASVPMVLNLLWAATLIKSVNVAPYTRVKESHLKVFNLFCHPRFSSILILTQRKIISSPPLKSMPNWTISPSLTGKALLSCDGGLRRMWLRNVPDELLTSLMYHLPFSYQNSQWRRLTTLLLKPTGEAEGWLPDALAAAWLSRSE